MRLPLALVLIALAGCVSLTRTNLAQVEFAAQPPGGVTPDDIWVGLAFSGGGHRATAFGLGVMHELQAADIGNGQSLADRVRFVAGVSGGAVLAAAFALDGAPGLVALRDRYLRGDAGRYMEPAMADVGLGVDLADGLAIGADPVSTFGRALDEDLFAGARFGDLPGQVNLRLVASDVARAAPFVFDAATFSALCADLDVLPLSAAVAASAAFPVVFAPVVIPAARHVCTRRESPALAAARQNPDAHPALRLLADTLADYAAVKQPVRLLDGGMSDSYGTNGFLAARAEGGLSPMTLAEAVRVRHLLFVAVDAAQENWRITDELLPTGRVVALTLYDLPQRLNGADSGALDPFLSGRAITATTTGSFSTLRAALTLWRGQIIAWRCDLAPAELDALFPDRPPDWDCNDLTVHLGEVRIDILPENLRDAMADVPTRLNLPANQIDLAIAAGGVALRTLPVWRDFRRMVPPAPG